MICCTVHLVQSIQFNVVYELSVSPKSERFIYSQNVSFFPPQNTDCPISTIFCSLYTAIRPSEYPGRACIHIRRTCCSEIIRVFVFMCPFYRGVQRLFPSRTDFTRRARQQGTSLAPLHKSEFQSLPHVPVASRQPVYRLHVLGNTSLYRSLKPIMDLV